MADDIGTQREVLPQLESPDRIAAAAAVAVLMAPAAAIFAAALTLISFQLAIVCALPLAVGGIFALLLLKDRSPVASRARAGLLAGTAGLLAYDLMRVGLMAAGLVSEPFKAIALYGESLLPRSSAAALVGWAYHVWNGLAFALAFVMLVRKPTVVKAILWALLLDTLQTLTVEHVPGIAVGSEFLTASIVGHLAYGASLGLVAHYLLTSPSRGSSDA